MKSSANLINTSQRVSQKLSLYVNFKIGVLQGNIISPLFLVILINAKLQKTNYKCIVFVSFIVQKFFEKEVGNAV